MTVTTRPRKTNAKSEYRLDDQVGFLLRVAMQRHTSIFMSRIVKGLTQTQFAALVSDRAYVLEKGHVQWQGAMAELAGDTATQRALLSM